MGTSDVRSIKVTGTDMATKSATRFVQTLTCKQSPSGRRHLRVRHSNWWVACVLERDIGTVFALPVLLDSVDRAVVVLWALLQARSTLVTLITCEVSGLFCCEHVALWIFVYIRYGSLHVQLPVLLPSALRMTL